MWQKMSVLASESTGDTPWVSHHRQLESWAQGRQEGVDL
jgi:hypothetical protein